MFVKAAAFYLRDLSEPGMENGMTTVKAVNNKGNVTHCVGHGVSICPTRGSACILVGAVSRRFVLCTLHVRLIRHGRRNQNVSNILSRHGLWSKNRHN